MFASNSLLAGINVFRLGTADKNLYTRPRGSVRVRVSVVRVRVSVSVARVRVSVSVARVLELVLGLV